MASAKFLEEALSTDVDESAVSAIVGSLENQLVTSASGAAHHANNLAAAAATHNHVNSGALPNGGTASTPATTTTVVPTLNAKAPQHNGAAGSEALALLNDSAPQGGKLVVVTSTPTNNGNNNIITGAAAQAAAVALQNVSSNNNFVSVASKSAAVTQHQQQAVLVNSLQTVGTKPASEGGGGGGGGGGTVKRTLAQVPGVGTSGNMNTIIANNSRVATYVTTPNGTIGLAAAINQTASAIMAGKQSQQQQQTIVIKTSNGTPQSIINAAAPTTAGAPMAIAVSAAHNNSISSSVVTNNVGGGASNLVTVGMNVATAVPQVNNVGSVAAVASAAPVLTNLTGVVNVRAAAGTMPAAATAKGQQATTTRVVLSAAPQMVAGRPGGAPQLTLQSLHGLQPGQQGHLLLKTENGQYQLLRVGPAPTATAGITANSTPGTGQSLTFRMQTMPTGATPTSAPIAGVVSSSTGAPSGVVQATVATPTNQKTTNDQTKEKCRKFLANLLELSSREPKTVERSVRTLIQELIDMRVEPEDFCERLERLLNASPQPCLIGFLKKSLPLLRNSLVTKELTIDGIRPPPSNVVYSIVSGAQTLQNQIRPAMATSQVRLVTPAARPGQLVQQRLVTPVRGALQPGTRMVTTIRQPNAGAASTPVIVSNSQPPALHPVYPTGAQVRPGGIVRTPLQVRAVAPGSQVRTVGGQHIITHHHLNSASVNANMQQIRGIVSKPPMSKDKDNKKSFSSAGGYTGDDDINDVAAMGGVNLAEETQRILGSTEFVGTQIRSCKEEFLLNMGTLQQRIRAKAAHNGLDDSGNEVAAVISHAVQERVKNLIDKLAVITTHRLEMVKSDQRYELTSEVKGQLKFLEDIDKAERKRHDEVERELLLRAAKSRSKTEDPEQAKLKAKAKEMQRVEMEELRQREANATALQAIGPRKKPRLDGDTASGSSQASVTGLNNSLRGQVPLRARNKKVTLRDLQFLFESEKDICKSVILYKSYLK